jgi:thymidylate kinase
MDGSGKDTVCDILLKSFPDSIYQHFPNYDIPSGARIKSILTKKLPFPGALEFQCLQVINKAETLVHLSDTYRKSPVTPSCFIFNRYKESTLVYGVHDEIQESTNNIMLQMLPDSAITIILSGKCYRMNNDHYEVKEKQDKINELYCSFAKQHAWNIVSNDRRPEEIVHEILKIIKNSKRLKI